MPELPEVETIRRDLEQKLVGKKIKDIKILVPHLIKKPSLDRFILNLIGEKIISIGRRGKYLLFSFNLGKILVIHLRMTGQLVYCSPEEEEEKHLCCIFALEDDGQINHLRYLDIRRFGCFYLLNPDETIKGLTNLGPEPLGADFTFSYLVEILQNKRGKIKALLLDQTIIAGIGNIYADEILFRSGIHPERTGNSLNKEEIRRIYENTSQVLQEAIERRGTTISDYRDGLGKKGTFQNYLKVYGRSGKKCLQCQSLIKKIKIGGRSSCFCPQCQI